MVKEGDFVYDSPEWVLHNGIGYVFPAGGNLFLSKKIQTGSWYSINHTESKMSSSKRSLLWDLIMVVILGMLPMPISWCLGFILPAR